MKLVLADGEAVIADDVAWARSFFERVRGLIGRDRLEHGRALVIDGAHQVHTFGLAYSLDVVFCDSHWVVRHIVLDMPPRRVTRWVRGARYAIELPAGSVPAEIRSGARIAIHP
ncbi:MAG: DUF192 domain-containing protein [Actinomycetota bacterium]